MWARRWLDEECAHSNMNIICIIFLISLFLAHCFVLCVCLNWRSNKQTRFASNTLFNINMFLNHTDQYHNLIVSMRLLRISNGTNDSISKFNTTICGDYGDDICIKRTNNGVLRVVELPHLTMLLLAFFHWLPYSCYLNGWRERDCDA